MFTLYTTPLSANGRKVLALCRQLGLEPRIETVDVYRGEGRSPSYLAVNPTGKIPTLVEGDFVLAESNAILQYVCEAHGDHRLWSTDPKQRAQIASWLFFEAAHWQPALVPVLTGVVAGRLFGSTGDAEPPRADWSDASLHPILARLEAHLERHPFLALDALTLADIAVAGMTTYFHAAAFPFEQYPGIAQWLARLEGLEAWRETEDPLWRAT